jgi:hypothetical protein
MTDTPNPALEWWSTLAPEVRKFWFHLITGWTIESAVNAAHDRAMGEAQAERVGVTPSPASGGPP